MADHRAREPRVASDDLAHGRAMRLLPIVLVVLAAACGDSASPCEGAECGGDGTAAAGDTAAGPSTGGAGSAGSDADGGAAGDPGKGDGGRQAVLGDAATDASREAAADASGGADASVAGQRDAGVVGGDAGATSTLRPCEPGYYPCADGCCAWQVGQLGTPFETHDPAFAIGADDVPRALYLARLNMIYASWNGAAWELEVAPLDVGNYSLAIGPGGQPHVAGYRSGLRYITRNASGWQDVMADPVLLGYVPRDCGRAPCTGAA